MSYRVKILARARSDFDAIIDWIADRSPEGADRLTVRFQEALVRVGENPFFAPIAPESSDVGEEIRHITFRTKAGRTFRALFVVVGSDVRILRVREASQRPLNARDLSLED
jgi:plasmid stabilization system protein ParE